MQALAEGEEDELVAEESMDIFLLGLLFFEVLVGRPLAPNPQARMLTYADVCGRMLTYADVCFSKY
jgi:hypothetical protein